MRTRPCASFVIVEECQPIYVSTTCAVRSVVRERSDLCDDHKQLEECESNVLQEYNVRPRCTRSVRVGSLVTARIQAFSEQMRDACGRKELEWADTPSAQCMYN